MTRYADFYRHSIDKPRCLLGRAGGALNGTPAPQQICDYSNPPLAKSGLWRHRTAATAVDRHLKTEADQPAVACHLHRKQTSGLQLQLREISVRRSAARGRRFHGTWGEEAGDRRSDYCP